MTRLITKSNFTAETIPLPPSLAEAKLNPSIDQAQNIDLTRALGKYLYADLIAAKAGADWNTSPYKVLMEGEIYQDSSGRSVIFHGLNMALIHWTYANFIINHPANVTSHGLVVKTDPGSQPMSSSEVSRLVSHHRAMAASYYQDAEKYLFDKKDSFPLYKSSLTSSPEGGIIISSSDDV